MTSKKEVQLNRIGGRGGGEVNSGNLKENILGVFGGGAPTSPGRPFSVWSLNGECMFCLHFYCFTLELHTFSRYQSKFKNFGVSVQRPGSAGVLFFLPNLRQDCHSIFASPKNLPPKRRLVREFLFVMVGGGGVNGRRGGAAKIVTGFLLEPTLSLVSRNSAPTPTL